MSYKIGIIGCGNVGISYAYSLINQALDVYEIVLIDIRYVNYTILDNYIDFNEYKDSDVLFLYSSRVINKSRIFR